MTIASKGSSLSLGAGNAAAAVASLLSLDGPNIEVEHFEVRTLDGNAGIEYLPTGYVEPGQITGDAFLTSANKSAVMSVITTLASTLATTPAVVSYGSGNAAITFSGAIASMGINPSAAMKDGVKAKLTAKASGTWV